MLDLKTLDAQTLRDLAAYVARLKHDLGKYVAFQVRWLPDEADSEALAAALEADVLHTRRGPGGSLDACTLWRELRPALAGQAPLPEGSIVDLGDGIAPLDRAMAEVAVVAAALSRGSRDPEVLRAGRKAVLDASEACRDLQRLVRGT